MREQEQPPAPGWTMDEDPVVLAILKAIGLKKIRPGAKVGEAELAEFFKINRARVRQALLYLASRKVLTLYPNRGAFVAKPSPKEAREIFAIRRTLEAQTVSLLVDTIDKDKAKILKESISFELLPAIEDRWDKLRIGHSFHAVIARLAGNAELSRIVEELLLRTSLIIARFETSSHDDCSQHAHPSIADLIISKQKAKAVAAMLHHLQEMEARLPLETQKQAPASITTIFGGMGIKPTRATGKLSR